MIRLDGISKSYGEKKVLDRISATIPDSGIFAVAGESGSGKTTLLKIIIGLESPDEGCVLGTQGKKFSVVFQNDRLLPWLSALDNVATVCDRDTAADWLDRVGLGDAALKKPGELSGGMCRRAALARALAFNGDVLLLDEPFKGLDAPLRDRMMVLVEQFSKKKPVVLITHDEQEFKTARASLNTGSAK